MTGTSHANQRHPEHPWVTDAIKALRSHLENDVHGLAEHLSKVARDYDAMQERNRTLQAENANLRARLAAYEATTGQVGTIEPDPTHPGRYVRKWLSDRTVEGGR